MAKKRTRRLKSVATELVKKAREAMSTSVQVFNNPQIEFKSELFIVTNIIAWTYLLHAHYRKKKIGYRRRKPGSKRFQRTKNGAIYHWSLEDCLNSADCPLDDIVKKNIRFLIGIRHEIEHQMTRQIDDALETDWPAGAAGFEPLHIRIGICRNSQPGGQDSNLRISIEPHFLQTSQAPDRRLSRSGEMKFSRS